MIYLIHGNDEYRLKKRLKELMGEESLNLLKFDTPFDFQKIKIEAETLPFLSDKKTIVLYDFLASKDKELLSKFEQWLENVPKETDLILFEGSVNQKSPILKLINNIGKAEEYNVLKSFELTTWIQNRVKELGGEITKPDAEKLGLMIGPDLVKAENELKKLISFDPKITAASVELLIKAEFSESIFALMDAVSEKNAKKSVKLLEDFLGNEENELYLHSMFARQVRNLLMVKSLADQRKSELEIAKITGLHPYVIKKTISQARNFNLEKLLIMHQNLVKTDLELKSSNIQPKVLLTRLILSFVSK